MPIATDPASRLADLRNWADGPPHAIFDELRAQGPVHWVSNPWGTQDSNGYWAVIGHAEVIAVGRDSATFTSTRGASYPFFAEEVASAQHGMMLQDDPGHARLRSLAGRSFSPRVVGKFDEWVRSITAECLDAAAARGRFDFVEDVASVIPAQVIAQVMGVPPEDRHLVVGWAKALFERDTPEGSERAAEGAVALLRYAMDLKELKSREPGIDMVTELLDAEYDGVPMTNSEYRHYIMLLLAAGFETTHTLMAHTARLMTEDPEIDDAARTAVRGGEVNTVTEEFLRFASPAMNMARFTTQATELGGRNLDAGQMVVMWFAAANRDPSVFDEPHRFDASRSPNYHLAFGPPGSPHYCLGHALGRLEGRVLLEELVQRDLRLRLTSPAGRSGGVFINAIKKLPVEVV